MCVIYLASVQSKPLVSVITRHITPPLALLWLFSVVVVGNGGFIYIYKSF